MELIVLLSPHRLPCSATRWPWYSLGTEGKSLPKYLRTFSLGYSLLKPSWVHPLLLKQFLKHHPQCLPACHFPTDHVLKSKCNSNIIYLAPEYFPVCMLCTRYMLYILCFLFYLGRYQALCQLLFVYMCPHSWNWEIKTVHWREKKIIFNKRHGQTR